MSKSVELKKGDLVYFHGGPHVEVGFQYAVGMIGVVDKVQDGALTLMKCGSTSAVENFKHIDDKSYDELCDIMRKKAFSTYTRKV